METNIIYNEECLQGMNRIKDKSIDMILCDLPYQTTQNRWDIMIPLDKLWEQYDRVIRDNGAVVLFSQMPFTYELANSNKKLFRYEWIWEKSKATGHLNSKKMPMKSHENILVFYKKAPTYNPQGIIKKPIPTIRRGKNGNGANYGKSDKDAIQEFENYPRDIIRFASVQKNVHPTQKSVALLEYLIKTYTNETELVLDNCIGSGSTAIACINTNRNYIGFELEKKYFDIANQRIQDRLKELEK